MFPSNDSGQHALMDIFLAIARHSSYYVADATCIESLQFVDRVKAKTKENPKLLNYAKAVYDLCWDENVSAYDKRSFLDLNMVFLEEGFDVRFCSELIEKFTKKAIDYKKNAAK